MSLKERKRAEVLYFTCKKSEEYRFELKKIGQDCSKHDLTSSICYCGSGGCQSLPKIVNDGRNNNIGDLFFELQSHANVSPILYVNLSHSQIFVPAQGQKQNGQFTGFCKVCWEEYQDYNSHIKIVAHLLKIAQNERNQWILDLCEEVQTQKIKKEVRKRKKDKYANENGKTKKLKYNSRDEKTGKFGKKCKE